MMTLSAISSGILVQSLQLPAWATLTLAWFGAGVLMLEHRKPMLPRCLSAALISFLLFSYLLWAVNGRLALLHLL